MCFFPSPFILKANSQTKRTKTGPDATGQDLDQLLFEYTSKLQKQLSQVPTEPLPNAAGTRINDETFDLQVYVHSLNALHVCHQATPHVAGCDSPNLNAPHCTPSLPFYLFIPASLEVCSFDSCILCMIIFSADSVDEAGKRTCPAANKKYGSPQGISEAVS